MDVRNLKNCYIAQMYVHSIALELQKYLGELLPSHIMKGRAP